MKKTAIACGIISCVLLAAFIVSVIFTGVNTSVNFGFPFAFRNSFIYKYNVGGRGYAAGETTTDVFEGEIRDIYVSTSVANTVVRLSDTDKATVKYTANTTGVSFGAVLEDGKLRIQETSFLFFNFNDRPSELEIVLPSKEYGTVSFDIASGSTAVNGLVCDSFTVETASGTGDYQIFANDLNVETASGSVEVINSQNGRRSRTLRASSASGSTAVSGFYTDSFDIDCASGSVTLRGVAGKGDIDAASGMIYVSYFEWNNDLDIDAASGSIDVQLPSGSGTDIDLYTFAGSVKYDLDGDDGSISGNSAASVGGSNVHGVNADIASGNIYLHN